MNKPADKMLILAEAACIREELLSIDREIKRVSHLIRNLPQKKRKLFRLREELCDKYNKLILEKELPLRKAI